MTAERWARITAVFRAALDMPADQRTAFLDETCRSDDALRRNVEKLLAAEPEPSLPSPVAELLKASTVELFSGELLAHYRVEVKIGEGGMGAVYQVYDTRLHRTAALKILKVNPFGDPECRHGLIREARAASALNHPNVVTIYEIGADRGLDFIAMEYVPGKTLAALIDRKRLSLCDALNYAVQVASALAAAHMAGLVHRDVKPANIIVNGSGQVKVLDFGLARTTEASITADTTFTQASSGFIAGTAAYMSPEQAEGKKVDSRSDVFSFGAVLYEMVTGKRAFERGSTAGTLAAILEQEPVPASGCAGGLPPELDKILMRCLRKVPAQRFQHMADVVVELRELMESLDRDALQTAGSLRSRRFHKAAWTLGLLLLVTAAVVGLWAVRSLAPSPAAVLMPVPLTSYPGTEVYPSFAPDGTLVAFRWCPEKEPCQIYIKQIGVEPPWRLTESSLFSDSPAWSPDGRTIACIRQLSPGRQAIVLIPQRGGRERVLAEFDDDLPERAGGLSGPYLTWTPDSKWVASSAFARSTSGRKQWALFMTSVDTGEKRRLTTPPDGKLGDTTPAFSPDGRTLVFSRGDSNRFDVYLLRLEEGYVPRGEPQRIASDNLLNIGPAWMPDGREIVFSSGDGLWRMSASITARARRLTFSSDYISPPAISQHGNRLAYGVNKSDINIWRLDLGRLAGVKSATPSKFIASTRPDFCPAYSADGRKIAFVSERSGISELWVCDRDGSNPAKLTSLGVPEMYVSQWSPSSDEIAFYADPGGNDDVYVISSNGGVPRRLTRHPAPDKWPSWSRDGKSLYFSSQRSGDDGIWKMPAAGGEPVRIDLSGVVDRPRESPDGRWIYFTRGYPPPVSLWRIPVAGGEQTKVLDTVFDWTVGNEGIYFIMPDEPGHQKICVKEFATGKIRTIALMGRPSSLGMAVSPDGRTLLYSQFDDLGHDLMLVENFH